MTLEEAIKHAEEAAEEQKELYRLCPASESDMFHCDGTENCRVLKNGKDKGCRKLAEEHRQLAEWFKELKRLREQTRWIPVNQPPKASGRYIVTRHFFDNDFVEMANYSTDMHTVDKYDFPKHKAGWYNDDSEYGHYELDDIVAWMPKPESYKASQMGKKAKR